MQIRDFPEKVEIVRRYRTSGAKQPAKVVKALGEGYRVMLPLEGETFMFQIKGKEVDLLMAEFPGTTELYKLFVAE